MRLLVWLFAEKEVEERHGAGVSIGCLDGPLVRHKVVLVEQLGAFGWLWDESLCLADVAHYDTAHVGIELLSCQLQVLICPQLLFSKLS